MTPEYYTVKDFKVGDFKDPNGNTWCNVLFEEKTNEPIKWVVKEPSSITLGSKVYGHIEEKTSQANKPYLRFYRDKVPDDSVRAVPIGQVKPIWQPESPEKQDSIYRSVALNDAAIVFQGQGGPGISVLDMADKFYSWLKKDVTHELPPEADEKASPRDWDKLGKHKEPLGWDLSSEDYPVDEIPFD